MAGTQTEMAQFRYGPQVNIPCPAANAPLNAGDVVDLGTFVGVALGPINANGDPGRSLSIQGVFSFLKGTGYAINLGDKVLWDASQHVAYVTGGGYSDDASLGKCVEAALSADTVVHVYLNPFAAAVSG